MDEVVYHIVHTFLKNLQIKRRFVKSIFNLYTWLMELFHREFSPL